MELTNPSTSLDDQLILLVRHAPLLVTLRPHVRLGPKCLAPTERASHGASHGASPGERASGRAAGELMMGLRHITHYTVFLPQPMIVKGTHSMKLTHFDTQTTTPLSGLSTTRSAPLAPHRIRCDRARLSDRARLQDSLSLSTRLPPQSHLTLPVEPPHEPHALFACAPTASNPPRVSLPCGA